MSVLETVTVDNVTYDMHDPKVGSGTLQTTAQTLIPAVNEVKSGLTTVSGKTDIIGSGSLNTTSQTLIGAVNELNNNALKYNALSGSVTIPAMSFDTVKANDFAASTVCTVNARKGQLVVVKMNISNINGRSGYAYLRSATAPIYIYTTASSLQNTDSDNYLWVYNSSASSGATTVLLMLADTTIKLCAYYEHGSITCTYLCRVI